MGERIGILLLNLGGPDRRESIRPFLENLFADREIIRLPGGTLGQRLIGGMIVRARLKSVIANYESIGGGSPILALTMRQATALERALATEDGHQYRVLPAMRYWHPFTAESLGKLADEGIRRVVALTLYPHYSTATTGSSVRELERVVAREFPGRFNITVIDRWPTLPAYLDSLAAKVEETVDAVDPERREKLTLLFSAHGLPLDLVRRGDPYVKEITETLEGVRERLRRKWPWRLAWQSRVGPVRWLRPTVEEELDELARAGCRDVVVIPISFVSDHVETLYEIDQVFAREAHRLGFITFRRSAALNDDPAFIDAIAGLVRSHLEESAAAPGTASDISPRTGSTE